MRSRWVFLAIPVIALAVPASAQQVDQNIRQQIEQVAAQFAEHFNKQDAIASMFTKDGVLVSSAATAVKTGPQAITENYENLFKTGNNHNQITVDQVSPFGTDAAISMGEYHLPGQGQKGPIKVDGHWAGVDVREGGVWKIRLLTAVPNPPTAAATQ